MGTNNQGAKMRGSHWSADIPVRLSLPSDLADRNVRAPWVAPLHRCAFALIPLCYSQSSAEYGNQVAEFFVNLGWAADRVGHFLAH